MTTALHVLISRFVITCTASDLHAVCRDVRIFITLEANANQTNNTSHQTNNTPHQPDSERKAVGGTTAITNSLVLHGSLGQTLQLVAVHFLANSLKTCYYYYYFYYYCRCCCCCCC